MLGNPPETLASPKGTSASGLSDESSSPDVLPPGFERNQLNQPNPEFCRGEGRSCGSHAPLPLTHPCAGGEAGGP